LTELKEKISMIRDAIEDKKGSDLEVLDISDRSTIADCFIIVSGNSSHKLNL
jgi:ribosome-associated protein